MHLLNIGKAQADQGSRVKTLEQLANVIDARKELNITTIKRFVVGDPKNAIVDYVYQNRIDAVVMGTHGRTGFAHMTMGSVAESVVRNAPCPVTILGPKDGENATHSQVIDVVAKLIESGLPNDEEESRTIILKSIVEHLRVSSTSAILMFNEVTEQGWVLFQDGVWRVVEGEELLDDLEPIVFNIESETQAIELVRRAACLRATDIHIDPFDANEFVVRLRIDGVLREYCRLDHSVGQHLINQCKTLAGIDQTDPFQTHEGRMRLPQHLCDLEVRLTSAPVPEGQAMALRILDPARIFKPLEELGLSENQLEDVKGMLNREEGLVLVTGPTGSGKSTTVYSMLQSIGGLKQNLVSIEDPVEYSASFVRQISVDPKHGITMVNGLKTLLRMDPDALFIGEIRDPETAEIALRAATGGMYVFTTLHTRDIASAIFSLENFNVLRESIVSHLAGIVNQRLVRQLCHHCKQEFEITKSQSRTFTDAGLQFPAKLYMPGQCSKCNGTGYRDRIGIFEVVTISDEFRASMRELSTPQELLSFIRSHGIWSLRHDALKKVAQGKISLDDAQTACLLS